LNFKQNNPSLLVEWGGKDVKVYVRELRIKEAELGRARCISRCTVIKEELMANRCAPHRVEQLLAQGLGLEEALEMLGLGAE
jgi:hypothetical protein